MADKVAFLATMPPADTPRISTMLGYALAAVSMGFDVLIFWTLEGAHVVKERCLRSWINRSRRGSSSALRWVARCGSAPRRLPPST